MPFSGLVDGLDIYAVCTFSDLPAPTDQQPDTLPELSVALLIKNLDKNDVEGRFLHNFIFALAPGLFHVGFTKVYGSKRRFVPLPLLDCVSEEDTAAYMV